MASDHVLRAISEDGAFRVVACLTTETVQGSIEVQEVKGAIAQRYADVLTGAVLVRETMAPDLRVQALLGDGGRNRLVADAHPEGVTRGLVQIPRGATAAVLDQLRQLTIMRTLHNRSIQQGHVEVPAGRPVADALMEYFRVSEQIASVVAVGSLLDGDRVVAAAGYIVQLLPEVTEEPLRRMTERLQEFPTMESLLRQAAADPRKVLDRLLEGFPHAQVASSPIRFGCQCSNERVLAGLATLPHHELAEMVAENEILEIGCDYCGKQYRIAPDHLRGMLANN
jgi:molecular chaperone Hsp33